MGKFVSLSEHFNVAARGNWWYVRRPAAVAVLVVCPETNEYLVVEQNRPPLNYKTYEIPAGLIDKGEDFSVAASRELEEETGLRINAMYLKWVNSFVTSPGFSDERIHLYFVKIDKAKKHQVKQKEKGVKPKWVSLHIEHTDLKTWAAIQWYKAQINLETLTQAMEVDRV